MTISLCMIVKNEEETLPKCLKSVGGIADEIIIVDTGSVDETKKVAAKFTDKIYDFTWIDDFSAARNYAFSKATCDYILWLDADDIFTKKDKKAFIALKSRLDGSVDVYMMKYNTGFDEFGNVTFSYFRERLVKREKGFVWREPVHEYIEIGGNIINSEIAVSHTTVHKQKSDRNLKIYESRVRAGFPLSARALYYYARELSQHNRYSDAAVQFIAFIESGRGWVEDVITACEEAAKCYLTLGDDKKALSMLFRSFEYDTPRGEICCQIGYIYKNRKEYQKALFWFNLVLSLKKPEGSWGFIRNDCWDYIPLIESSVCCDKIAMYEKAEEYNERAALVKPDSAAVLYNRKYFNDRKGG